MASSVASAGDKLNPETLEKKPSGGTPKITRKLKGKRAAYGNQTILSCAASAEKDMKITWFKNGAEFDVPVVTSQADANKHRVHMRQEKDDIELVLNNVRGEDAGYYLCVASNEHGEASSMAELSIR